MISDMLEIQTATPKKFSFPINVKSIMFLRDGNVASTAEDCKIQIWETQTGKAISELPGHEKEIHSFG